MQHTRLTTRNYASFASAMFVVGLVSTGLGTVDLIMIAPKGVDHVAAVGQGELLVVAVSVFVLGMVEAFSGRLAIAEGEGTAAQRLPVLAAALLMVMLLCQLLGLVVAIGIAPVLNQFGQDPELVALVEPYVAVRMLGIIPLLLYAALNEMLKVRGGKNLSLVALVIGFVANALLNWLFLYTSFAGNFSSPESAIAASTVIAQLIMGGFAAWMVIVASRNRGERFERPDRTAALSEFRSMTAVGAGVGVRHVNDYMGSIVPIMFIGTMGPGALAAAVVAAKIYTVFCRVPQACFQATFVYYGYAIGQNETDRSGTVRRLQLYAAIPTVVAATVVAATSPWLVTIFGNNGLDRGLTVFLLLAYLLYLPAYFFDQSLSTMLVVHQRGGLLFTSSTVLTYLVTIPLSWIAVFVLHSAFLAVACSGVAIAIQASIYWRSLRGELWTGM